MANTKISNLTAATTPLAGTEVLPIVQSGATVQVSVANLTPGLGTITAVKGGTGQTSYAVGDLLYANTTTTLAKLADVATGNALISGGVNTAPSYGKIGLTTHVSGTLPVANGGTGVTTSTGTGNTVLSSSPTLTNLLLSGGTLPGVSNPSIALRSSDNIIYHQSGSANNITFLDSAQNAMYIAAATSHTWNISNVTKMSINSSGVVTMNNYGAGTATFSAAGVISSVSDETWKIKDGVPVNPNEMLQKLEPGYWFYNDEKKETFGADRQLGFYAQNVHAAIGEEAAPVPEKVKDQDGNDTEVFKPWGYYDRSVLAVVVMSLKNALSTIQEQQASITQLQARLDAANL